MFIFLTCIFFMLYRNFNHHFEHMMLMSQNHMGQNDSSIKIIMYVKTLVDYKYSVKL